MVTNANCAELFYLFPATFYGRKAKAICTDHNARMQDAMLTDGAICAKRDVRLQPRTCTNTGTLLNHTQGANPGAWVDNRFGMHHSAWMDQGFAVLSDLLLAPQLGHFGEIQIRIGGNNASRASTDQRLHLWRHNHTTRLGGSELGTVKGIAQERQRARSRSL